MAGNGTNPMNNFLRWFLPDRIVGRRPQTTERDTAQDDLARRRGLVKLYNHLGASPTQTNWEETQKCRR